jgi:glycosyltransferase involved in cell wall biosynthesis
VVLVFDRLGTGAGGEGTMLDFARALLLSEFSVAVLVARSSWIERRRFARLAARDGVPRGSLSVHPVSRLLDFRVSPSITSESWNADRPPRLTALRFMLDPRRLVVAKALRKSQIVMVALTLTARGVRQLRTFTSGSIVLNHNGQPQDFYSKWKRGLATGPNAALLDYEEYLSQFDMVLFQSNPQEEEFLRRHGSLPIHHKTIWPSCDEAAALEGREQCSPFEAGTFNFLCVGKFQKRKRQLELVKAFAVLSKEFPSARLTFIGGRSAEWEYYDTCVDKARELGVAMRVSFAGFQGSPYRFIAHCDVVVAVSRSEGVSRALREAAFLSRAIICTRLDGSEGFLGPEGALYIDDDDELHERIMEAMKRAMLESGLPEKLGAASRGAFDEKASWPVFVSCVATLMSEVQSGSRALPSWAVRSL